jgi:hypothetical protein
MTSRVPELAECLPANVQLDGELIAWDCFQEEVTGARRLHWGKC